VGWVVCSLSTARLFKKTEMNGLYREHRNADSLQALVAEIFEAYLDPQEVAEVENQQLRVRALTT
jgi:hypothetical protein